MHSKPAASKCSKILDRLHRLPHRNQPEDNQNKVREHNIANEHCNMSCILASIDTSYLVERRSLGFPGVASVYYDDMPSVVIALRVRTSG